MARTAACSSSDGRSASSPCARSLLGRCFSACAHCLWGRRSCVDCESEGAMAAASEAGSFTIASTIELCGPRTGLDCGGARSSRFENKAGRLGRCAGVCGVGRW